MNDKASRPKIEHRDGKIFVEEEKQAYVQGMVRHLRMSATELSLHRSIWHDPKKGVDHLTYSLSGKAHLRKDALSVIADKAARAQELSLTLKPWPKEVAANGAGDKPDVAQHGHWRGLLGYIEHDWEIGSPAVWFAEVYLPPPVFDELAGVCRKGSLSTLSLSFETDLWVRDLDRHTPIGFDLTWFLSPGEYGVNMAALTLENFDWSEKPLALRRKPEDLDFLEDQEEASVIDPEQKKRKQFETSSLAIAEHVRQALYVIAGALVLVVLILALR